MKARTLSSNGKTVVVYDIELVLGMIKQWVDAGWTKEEAISFIMDAGTDAPTDDDGYMDALLNDKFLQEIR